MHMGSKVSNVCLHSQSLSDIQMPTNLPVSMRMHNQGYTSDTLTMDGLRNMDLTYYGEAPSSAGNAQRASTGRHLADGKPHRLPALRKSKTYIGLNQKSSNTLPGRTSLHSYS